MLEPATDQDFSDEELEALGEEKEETQSVPPAEEPPAEEPKEEGEGEPSETPAEEPPAEDKTFTQAQVEELMKDRVSRVQREIQEENQQLKERLESLEKGKVEQPQEAVSAETQDLGVLFNDPRWSGWTLESLQEQGYTDHYYKALGRIGAIEQFDILSEQSRAVTEEQRRSQEYDQQIADLNKDYPEYFDPVTSKPNESFKELYEWGAENGVYNLVAAHKLKNLDALIEKAKKDALTEQITEAGKDGQPKRMSHGEGLEKASKPLSQMSDEELQQAYLDADTAEYETALEKEQERRGLL